MFSPFYTSKEGGTGLGLAITKKVVEAHRGTIEVLSEPGRGAEFVVTFPKESGREGGAS
jgi:two-component system sensor histidine kinase HydH